MSTTNLNDAGKSKLNSLPSAEVKSNKSNLTFFGLCAITGLLLVLGVSNAQEKLRSESNMWHLSYQDCNKTAKMATVTMVVNPTELQCVDLVGTLQWESVGCPNITSSPILKHALNALTALSEFNRDYAADDDKTKEDQTIYDGLGVPHQLVALYSKPNDDSTSPISLGFGAATVDLINNFLSAEESDYWRLLYEATDYWGLLYEATENSDAVAWTNRYNYYQTNLDQCSHVTTKFIPIERIISLTASSASGTSQLVAGKLALLKQKLKYFFTSFLLKEERNGLLGQAMVNNISCSLRSDASSAQHSHSRTTSNTVIIYLTNANDTHYTYTSETQHRFGDTEYNYRDFPNFTISPHKGELLWFSSYVNNVDDNITSNVGSYSYNRLGMSREVGRNGKKIVIECTLA